MSSTAKKSQPKTMKRDPLAKAQRPVTTSKPTAATSEPKKPATALKLVAALDHCTREWLHARITINAEWSGNVRRSNLRDWHKANDTRLGCGLTPIPLAEIEDYDQQYTDPDDRMIDPFDNGHQQCTVCGECATCNLRPCRDGGPHHPQET